MGESEARGAQLLRENEQLREQRRAISDVLRAVASSAGLQPVLDEVVEACRQLCDADNAALWLLDDGLLRSVADHGEPEGAAYDRQHPHPLDRTTVAGRTALTRQPVHIPDVDNDREYGYRGPRPYRALLGVPVVVEDDLIGVIILDRSEPRPFSDEHIALAQTFADQAAIAIANARLIEAVERQLEQQRAIGDVLQAIALSKGLEAVFQVAVEAATRLCHADFGALYLADRDVFRLSTRHKSEPALDEFEREHPHVADRKTAIGRVALTRDVVHIPDVEMDPEYEWGGRHVAEYHAVLAVPVLVEDELIGVIDVTRRAPGPFAEEEVRLIRTFADQAAIAIANARLMDAVERQKSELSRFISPQVAELISSDEGRKMLAGHRAYISCLFCDLRGFTAFAETAAPEEHFEVLRAYHEALGELIPQYEGTLEHFAGDGVLVFFNDPVPIPDAPSRAVTMAVRMREEVNGLAEGWHRLGYDLGFGVGISRGFATLGRIGFEGRYDYAAIGTVTNLSARLSAYATAGQILVSQRVMVGAEDVALGREVGPLELRGFSKPLVAYEIVGLKDDEVSA
jgi:GAF domain-containing protein